MRVRRPSKVWIQLIRIWCVEETVDCLQKLWTSWKMNLQYPHSGELMWRGGGCFRRRYVSKASIFINWHFIFCQQNQWINFFHTRFWLARAVESYLRGSTSYCDQVFLLRRGLLQHITANIINTDMRLKEILQSSFDLLGELVKFNYDAFIVFETVLNTEERVWIDRMIFYVHLDYDLSYF